MLKRLAHQMARRLGLEVRRFTAVSDPLMMLGRFARASGATTVIDVGANIGQFAEALMRTGWEGRILSFEPLPIEHAELKRKAAGNSLWEVGPRVAIGLEHGTANINVAGNSVSSSLRSMLDAHLASAPQSAFVGTEEVPVVPLDEAIASSGAQGPFLLKIDVQGFEAEVIAGAPATLGQSTVVYLEMSLQPLYGGELLFNEISGLLMQSGFRCAGLFPGHFDAEKGEMLQVDGLFVR